jgi:3-ketosteroid 9alpha-monooxygenase subunit A
MFHFDATAMRQSGGESARGPELDAARQADFMPFERAAALDSRSRTCFKFDRERVETRSWTVGSANPRPRKFSQEIVMSRFPFARYPNGWFQVAYSHELENGAVKPLRYFGKDLVLFRTESGAAHVLDAYCPHLGAHLGHGGKVEGECVRCPFHAWQFDGSGACTSVPYAKKIPPKAKIRPWTVREVNGLVMVHFHGQGEPASWEIPELVEYGSPEWTPYEYRSWKIRTHNQEMAENSCDSAHFLYLHGTQEMPTSKAEQHGHILHTVSETLMKTPQGKTKGSVEVHLHGFGFTLTRFRGIVETLLVSSATTIDEDYVELRFAFTVRKLVNQDVTSTVGQAFIREVTRQLEQDIPIWENKRYIERPMLVDGDGPIALFRRWAKQFYSEPGGAQELRPSPQESAAQH